MFNEKLGWKFNPFEVKLTKTPNFGMAGPINRFRKVFAKLKIGEAKIISLREDEIRLTEDVSAIGMDSYLGYLNTFIP